MRCCVPFCKATAEIVSESAGISFHEFPSEVHLRAAWLRALGKQDTLLPEHAVVCSLHFFTDDICSTESGSRQIRTGAIPSMVQVCMICLDTHSKLFPMSKYKLDEAYQHLVGLPPCDQGNLKQTLCVQCAQRLMNFSRFRDKSLRARALMMELVDKHELITIRHMKSINRVKHQLISGIVKIVLEPDHCDVHIAHSDTDTLTELDTTVEAVAVKHERRDSLSVDADHTRHVTVMSEKISDADSFTGHPAVACKEEYLSDDSELSDTEQMSDALLTTPATTSHEEKVVAPIKQEMTFACTTCLTEFADEDTYIHHIMMMHIEHGDGDGECDTSRVWKPHTAVSSSSSHSSLITENRPADPSPSAHASKTLVALWSAKLATHVAFRETDAIRESKQVFEINNGEFDNQSSDTSCKRNTTNNSITDCVVKLYDVFKMPNKSVKTETKSEMKERKPISSCEDRNIDRFSDHAATRNAVHTTKKTATVPAKLKMNNRNVLKKLRSATGCSSDDIRLSSSENNLLVEKKEFTCDICEKTFNKRSQLVRHLRPCSKEKLFSCKFCQFKYKYKCYLKVHMRTHSGIKRYSCELCKYRTANSCHLKIHMSTHTGIKPFSCELCAYKCVQNSSLAKHMRTHAGEKRYSCSLCDCKFILSSDLVRHMRTHTGEKPYTCDICEQKFSRNSHLVDHMRTHTGVKPFRCELCAFKSIQRTTLVMHMRTHTGEKPFLCLLCSQKYARKSYLVEHMRIHTGEKPFSCKICEYKCAHKSTLRSHIMRTHPGEKPSSCS